MAWEVQDFQEQVQTLTNHAHIADKTLRWLNRTLMELTSKAYWTKQVVNEKIAPESAAVTTLTDNWFTATAMTDSNPIAVHRLTYSTAANIRNEALKRNTPQDLYAHQHGLGVEHSTGDPERYAVMRWVTGSVGGDYYMLPQIAIWPQSLTTADEDLDLAYLSAPDKFTAVTDDNWFTNKYPQVVLAGVMRYASLYIGDPQLYRLWKGKFENGVKDMLLNEEAHIVSAPVMRAVVPEEIMRGG